MSQLHQTLGAVRFSGISCHRLRHWPLAYRQLCPHQSSRKRQHAQLRPKRPGRVCRGRQPHIGRPQLDGPRAPPQLRHLDRVHHPYRPGHEDRVEGQRPASRLPVRLCDARNPRHLGAAHGPLQAGSEGVLHSTGNGAAPDGAPRRNGGPSKRDGGELHGRLRLFRPHHLLHVGQSPQARGSPPRRGQRHGRLALPRQRDQLHRELVRRLPSPRRPRPHVPSRASPEPSPQPVHLGAIHQRRPPCRAQRSRGAEQPRPRQQAHLPDRHQHAAPLVRLLRAAGPAGLRDRRHVYVDLRGDGGVPAAAAPTHHGEPHDIRVLLRDSETAGLALVDAGLEHAPGVEDLESAGRGASAVDPVAAGGDWLDSLLTGGSAAGHPIDPSARHSSPSFASSSPRLFSRSPFAVGCRSLLRRRVRG